LACLDGFVRQADYMKNGYGMYIVLQHADGFVTWYAHLSEFLCKVGDYVERGGIIGKSGDTGRSTGPHLHLTVQRIGHGLDGYWLRDVVDPLPLL